MNALAGRTIPITLFWQHMPAAAHFADSACDPEEVLIWRITQCLATYHSACNLDT
jgi:D-tagatose-1,6-bisphosphate aldolase subunit GatZ/KbaZ